MASLSPEELDELLGLGGLGDQEALLAQRLRAFQAMRPPEREYRSPWGAALGGLGSILGTVGQGLAQKQYGTEMQALTGRRLAGREKYAAAAQGLPVLPDAASLYATDPAIASKAQADMQKALAERERLGFVGQASGDPVLGRMAGSLLEGTVAQRQGLGQAPGQRLALALQTEALAKAQREGSEAAAPALGTYTDLAAKFGVQLSPGATNAQARQVLELAERAYSAEQRAKEANLNRWALNERLRETQESKDEEKRSKAEVAASLLDVPGYDRPPGAPGIKPEEAAEFRKATAGANALGALSESLRSTKREVGREFLPFTEDAKKVEAAATGMTLALKDLAATGALDQGTIDIASKLIPTRTDDAASAEKKLDEFNRFIREKIAARGASLGYAPRASRAAPAPGAAVRRTDPATGETRVWNGSAWVKG